MPHRPHSLMVIVLRMSWVLLFGAMLSLTAAVTAQAHELRPSIVDLTFAPSGTVMAEVSLNLEAFMVGITGEHADTRDAPEAAAYDALRAMDAVELERAFRAEAPALLSRLTLDADLRRLPFTLRDIEFGVAAADLPRISTLTLSTQLPEASEQAIWHDGGALGDTVLRARAEGAAEPFYSRFIQAGAEADRITLDGTGIQSGWSSFTGYIPVGFDHILPKGLDHILFVVGLFLLSPQIRPLLAQVTMFTLAHSVTLAFGLFDVIPIAPAIVEPLIAASIVFIAVENLFTTRLSRWRPFVVFGFGLLHGLGFAGVLAEFGLPEGQYLPALIGFNLGVELGQLTVLALCFLSVGLWFSHRVWYRGAITMPASLSVAAIGAFWVVERIL